jgi:hypothetical protein
MGAGTERLDPLLENEIGGEPKNSEKRWLWQKQSQ